MGGYRRTTVADTYSLIRSGQAPWIAIGDFLDDFYSGSPEDRHLMVADPIADPVADPANPAAPVNQDPPGMDPPEMQRWAAFLAAAVDWLCWKHGMEAPEWVYEDRFRLEDPWFLYEGWRLRAWQLVATPVPFRMRNIFCGDRALERV